MSRFLAHSPTLLYRARLGWLLGSRFLLLEHVGRRTGRRYSTVVEVVTRNTATNAYYVAAGFGERSDWYRNILARPHVGIQVGGRRFEAIAERLEAKEAEVVLATYAHDHCLTYRSLAALFGFRGATAAQLAQRFPIVRLRTTQLIASAQVARRHLPEGIENVALAGGLPAGKADGALQQAAC